VANHWYALSAESDGVPVLVGAVLAATRPYALLAELRAKEGLDPAAPPTAAESWSALAGRRRRGFEAVGTWLRRVARVEVPVRVAHGDDVGWARIADCAPWVDTVDMLSPGQMPLGRIHEGGRSAVLQLGDDEAQALAVAVGSAVQVQRLPDRRPWYKMGE
jgi:hypothetical protein